MSFLWFLSEFRTPILEQLALYITEFGYENVLIVLICCLFWCVDKKTAYKAGFSFCVSSLLVQGLKLGFRIERPWILDKNFRPVKKAVGAATGYSFPSGHTQSATSIYGSLLFSAKKKGWKILCVILPVLVGFSRMFLGVHTPKDVITAFGVAVISVVFVEYFFPFMEGQNGIRTYVLMGICLLGAVVSVVYGYCLFRQGIVSYEKVLDSCKGAGTAAGFVFGYIIEANYIRFSMPEKITHKGVCLVVGLVLLILLKVGLKAVMGTGILLTVMRYVLLIVFIMAGYPFIFEKVLNRKGNGK